MTIDADWAFARYEAIRPTLPEARFPEVSRSAANLTELADHYDAFILDAFGVLNRGDTAIPGAVEHLATLRAMGKRLIVLTNAASYPRAEALAKYRRFGFEVSDFEVVSSRDVTFAGLSAAPAPGPWAAISAAGDSFADAPVALESLLDDSTLFDRAGGFVFLSTARWTETFQARLTQALRDRSRPLIVGNSDLVAPREEGLSIEPGAFAHRLWTDTGVAPRFFGKPYGNAFAAALDRLSNVPRDRIAMVGDTLHTDILGGAAAGVGTVLITDHGLFAGRPVQGYIDASGIRPDWILPTT